MWAVILTLSFIITIYLVKDMIERAKNYEPAGWQFIELIIIWMITFGFMS